MLSLKAAALLLAASAQAAPASAPSSGRRLFSFGSITADPTNPTGASVASVAPQSMGGTSGFGGMPFPMMPGMDGSSSGSVPMLSADQEASVSAASDQFTEAAITAFLGKTQLPPAEMQCIQDGSGEIAGNVGKVASQFGLILQQALGVNVPLIPDLTTASPGAAFNPFGASSSSSSSSDGAGSIGSMADQILAGQSGQAQTAARAPALAVAAHVPAPATTAAPAPVSPSDPSMDFFYNSGRRLAMLPGMPVSSGTGVSSMMGPQSFPMAMELGFTMKQIVSETQDLIGTCIHSDAKSAFQQAGQHAMSLKHITGHFMANGADIVNELSDAVLAYEKKNATQFGTDFGTAMRKLFLSNNTNGNLPEGLPDDKQIANLTSGFLQGFFGKGTFLNVHLAKDPNNPLNVDMHNCVQKNVAFFQQIWGAGAFLFEQKAAGVSSTPSQGGLDSDAGRIQFGTTLAFTMMEMPSAMSKCGISSEQQSMIMDAVKSMGAGVSTKVQLPGMNVSKTQLTDDFAALMKEWSAGHWFEAGTNLGALMQESAVKFYPMKYSIDANGFLRRQLLPQLGAQGGMGVLMVMPAALMMVAAFMVVKNRRLLTRGFSRPRGAGFGSLGVEASDLEDGGHLRVEECAE